MSEALAFRVFVNGGGATLIAPEESGRPCGRIMAARLSGAADSLAAA